MPTDLFGNTIRASLGPDDTGVADVDAVVARHADMLRAHRDATVAVRAAEAAITPAQQADLDAAATALAAGATAPGRPAEAQARRTLDDATHARKAADIAVDRAAAEVERVVSENRPALLERNDDRLTVVRDDIATHVAALLVLDSEHSQLLAQRNWIHQPTRSMRAGATSIPTMFGNRIAVSEQLAVVLAQYVKPVDPVPRFPAAALVLAPDADADADDDVVA